MARAKLWIIGSASMAAGLLLTAAQQPSALAQTHAGLWEVTGAPGSKAPERQCLANITSLAEFEHRGKACHPKVISNDATSMVIEYSCGSAGFGRSQLTVITPRSLRIETQGISNRLPFNYTLQARRIGDCPAGTIPPRH